MICELCQWQNPYTSNLSFCPNCGAEPRYLRDLD